MSKSKEIWEIEGWGTEEWIEQTMAEIGFAKLMNVQHTVRHDRLNRNVAGYRVRRASNDLVLVPSDSDEDIFVAVQVETPVVRILGWLRGSEGKRPEFFQGNRWIIPPEALRDIEQIPGKERLKAMPPFQEPTPWTSARPVN